MRKIEDATWKNRALGSECGRAGAATARMLAIGSLLAMAILIGLLVRKPEPRRPLAPPPLVVYCAAGLKPPVEAVAREYEQATGVPIQLQYGGSGTLLSNIRVAKRGDLFLAADASYIAAARGFDLLDEAIPLARQRPVIAVARGNPLHIRSVEDLWRGDVRVELANPDAASIGRTVRELLRNAGQWAEAEKHITVFKPTVNEVANDVKLGAVDAGIVWDATARQYPELELVRVPLFDTAMETVSIGVLKFSQQPTAALRFARYLGARDKGLQQFAKHTYEPVDGDPWAETPEITLYSGAMLRPAIEKTLKTFEGREGCRITTVYNGCGILTAQMKTGTRPDGYFACDVSFMKQVADLYLDPVSVSDNALVILVQKGNPLGIQSPHDLAKPGVRVGLGHPEKAAMGTQTRALLDALGLTADIGKNVKVESPTGDFLVNQIRTGSLDAVIAGRSNATTVRDVLDAIEIRHPLALMTQPYAVGRESKYRQLMLRLRERLLAADSRQQFESAGFHWRTDSP